MKGGKSRKPVAGTILDLIREVGDAAVERVTKEYQEQGGSKTGRKAAAKKSTKEAGHGRTTDAR